MTNTAETADHIQATGRRGKPGNLHQSIVAKIIAEREGSCVAGFHAAHDTLCDELGIDRYRAKIIPDAYRINRDACEIEIYEVEIRSPLTPPKVQALGALWEFWDSEVSDWEPVLFVADRYGNISRMELSHVFYGTGWAEQFTGREHGAVSPQFHRNHRDLRGHRNGRLVALEPVGVHKGGHVLWRCRCDCGGEAIAQSNNLIRHAGTKSCGCLRREASRRRLKRDGAWNEGKSYAIAGGEHCYKTRHAWAKAALRQLGNKCQRCGWDEARCDVHHIVEKSKGGLHTLSNARVLCPNCHRVEHERGHQ